MSWKNAGKPLTRVDASMPSCRNPNRSAQFFMAAVTASGSDKNRAAAAVFNKNQCQSNLNNFWTRWSWKLSLRYVKETCVLVNILQAQFPIRSGSEDILLWISRLDFIYQHCAVVTDHKRKNHITSEPDGVRSWAWDMLTVACSSLTYFKVSF